MAPAGTQSEAIAMLSRVVPPARARAAVSMCHVLSPASE